MTVMAMSQEMATLGKDVALARSAAFQETPGGLARFPSQARK